ncbi:MAG: hypothetical protein EOP83_10310 [Verrucomicrobiaceae bacterium]|nr:MAG: hypothetical protein EOP83_10310 [Verrucomicrobiaceae bacterium]
MARGRSHEVSLEEYVDVARPKLKWIVRWPSGEPGGRRKEKRFKLKTAAKAFKEQKEIDVLNKGAERASVHSDAVDEVKWAMEALAPLGISIRDAVQAYIDRHHELSASVEVGVAVKKFLESKERDGMSKRYRDDIRLRLERFVASHGKRIVCDLTVAELDRWLTGLGVGPVSRNNYRRNLGVFFEWCARMSYCTTNPMRRTSRAKKRPTPVGIFTSENLKVILGHAPDDLLPALALGGLAGLRVAEIERLDWSEIRFEKGHIEVAAEKSKTASRRFVPMEPALKLWLEPIAKKHGAVTAHRLNERLSEYRAILAKEESKDGIVVRPAVKWVSNGLRHSFASYAIAREESADRVALWLGHTSAKMTFEHYQERATREEAKKWFSVIPVESSTAVKCPKRSVS